MFKTILVFIKAHTIATAITTTVVVGTAVATPIVVENYKLDKNVRGNLDILVSSDYNSTSDNEEAEKNVILNNDNNNEQPTENISTNNKQEELTFIVKRIEVNVDVGTSIEYKIVPSYDKDYSKWSKAEKEAYQKAFNEALELSKEENERLKTKEEQTIDNIEQNLQLEFQKLEQSYSKDYKCYRSSGICESWKYNSYAKLYTCSLAATNYGESIVKPSEVLGNRLTGVTKADFRNIVYPILKREAEMINSSPEMQVDMSELEELYHLSD